MARKTRNQPSITTPHRSHSTWLPLVCFLSTLILSVAVFGTLRTHEFIGLDDQEYVTANPMVLQGLSARGIRWAFTTFTNANWHPLTWISHQLDCTLYGLNPGMHLMTNLLFHSAASLLLFWWLFRMTKNLWASQLVALLFLVHPLHVESVAWVSERKDVLSGFFWMLTILLYSYFVEGRIRLWIVVACFGLGLLSKPMLVTLPFVLLLLDYWPLNRFSAASVREKIPFFVLTLASAVVTFIAQSRGGAVQPLHAYPFSIRLGNAIVSYILYIWKLIWPSRLAIFYPFVPQPAMQIAIGVLVLATLTCAAIFMRRKAPYLFTGWFWYLGTLLPVIGIVQVGEQAMADRYAYLPSVGLFVCFSWGIRNLVLGKKLWKQAAFIGSAIIVFCFSIAAARQVDLWRNSFVLFEHTLSVTSNNFSIENNLGLAYYRGGQPDKALNHLENAVRIAPRYTDARINLGLVYAALNNLEAAESEYRQAMSLDANSAEAHYNLGVLYANTGKIQEALSEFDDALRSDPGNADAYSAAGLISLQLGKKDEAYRYLQNAVRLKPDSPDIHNNMGLLLASLGRYEEAEREYETALRLKPDFPTAQKNLERMRELIRQPR